MTELAEQQSAQAGEFSPNYEQAERLVATFDEYRNICDNETNAFRKVGVQDAEAYEQAVNDPRTVFAKYYEKTLPLLTPLELEKMYEFSRCDEMLDGRELMLLALPLGNMNQQEVSLPESIAVAEPGMAILVESFENESGDSVDQLHSLPFLGVPTVTRHEFVNPLLENSPGHETSWMAAYRYTLRPKNREVRLHEGDEPPYRELMDSWANLCRKNNRDVTPGEQPQGTYLLSNDELAARTDIVDSLWAISEVGFGKILGAHHPVSMEFNREFFDSQITSSDTITAIYYEEGKPVCFGFVGVGMHHNEWLNCDSTVIQQELAEAKENKQLYAHFYELISNGIEGMGYSTHIINSFYDLIGEIGYESSVFFESTNLSATYIPAILEKQANNSEAVELSHNVKQLGKLRYSALVIDNQLSGADLQSPA